VKVTARPRGRTDDVALAVYRKRATRLGHPLARSAHRGRGRTERLRIRRRGTYYVAVTVQRRARDLDAAYALRVG
jgi:hypothetical protein